MRKDFSGLAFTFCLLHLALGTCAEQTASEHKTWALEQVKVIDGLLVPECVVVDPGAGLAYISNIETGDEGYWVDDAKGCISQVDGDGKIKALRWLDSTAQGPINAPKGMCILEGMLYFADNNRLMRAPISTAGPIEQVSIENAEKLNDLATDGKAVYAGDTAKGLIYRVDPKGACTVLKAPATVNGITFDKGRMFVVTWDDPDVYEMDPTGQKDPQPFGLTSHFTNLDGVEVLDDGAFIVSDFFGNKVLAITPDRKTVYTLAEVESPADIGIDRKLGMLYVPLFMKNQVIAYRLKAW